MFEGRHGINVDTTYRGISVKYDVKVLYTVFRLELSNPINGTATIFGEIYYIKKGVQKLMLWEAKCKDFFDISHLIYMHNRLLLNKVIDNLQA